MASLNKVLLIGNLTRDPELRYTPSGSAVAEFGMALNRFWKGQDGGRQEETTFVDITAWGRQAELANQYLNKGRRVFIEGRLKLDQWTNNEGQKRSKLSVVAENIQFLDGRGEGGGPGGGGGGQQQYPGQGGQYTGGQNYGGQGGQYGGGPPQGGYPNQGGEPSGGGGFSSPGQGDYGQSQPPDDDIPF